MTKRYRDPEAPEVLEAVLERIQRMTRKEWLQELARRPQGAEETWRMQSGPDRQPPEIEAPQPTQAAIDEPKEGNPDVHTFALDTGRC